MEEEAHFYVNGCANTQNFGIWDMNLPNVVKQFLLESEMITFCCSFTAEINYHWPNTEAMGSSCSITAEKCRHMLNNFLNAFHQKRQCLENVISMLSSALPHTFMRLQMLLRQKFTTEWIIIRYYDKSSQLNEWFSLQIHRHFWIWGYLKSISEMPLTCLCCWITYHGLYGTFLESCYILLLWMLWTEWNMWSTDWKWIECAK